jgi:membrane carboxypeptidase/penicillin-binding protein
MLENVINHGTAQTIRNMGYNGICAGKTGTTNDFTDAWFIGFTPDIVVGVWIGFDTKEPLGKNMTGGVVAAPLWAEFMMNAFPNQNQEFPVPDNIIFKKICSKTGMLATKYCPNPIDAPFVQGTEPHENCNLHSGVEVNNFLNQDLEQGATDNFTSDEESGENATGTAAKNKPGKSAKPKKQHEETEDEDNLAF